MAIIGKSNNSRCHAIQISKLLPLFIHSNAPVRKNLDTGILTDDLPLLLQVFHAVRNRIQIRHGTYGCITASRPGHGTGTDRLLIRKTRLTKVYMHIRETGKQKTIIQRDNSGVHVIFHIGGKRNNDSVLDKNVCLFMKIGFRQINAGNEILHQQ